MHEDDTSRAAGCYRLSRARCLVKEKRRRSSLKLKASHGGIPIDSSNAKKGRKEGYLGW